MSRTIEMAAAPPKVSFTNWLLGGDLVTTSTRGRRPGQRLPRIATDSAPKPKYTVKRHPKLTENKAKDNTITDFNTSGKRHRHNRRVSKDKGTDTEKDAEKENKKKEEEIDTGNKAVPKDEVAKKEELDKKTQISFEWTKSQDEKILAMKKAGNSWKMISQKVGASKKDVTNRYKELSASAEKSGGDDDSFSLGHMPGMFKDDEPPATSESHTQPPKEQQKEEHKVVVDAAAVEVEEGKRVLAPDAVWTIGDLEVLASVEQRYRELKWMHVQAGFYNLTGRMVGSEMIKAKFEQG